MPMQSSKPLIWLLLGGALGIGAIVFMLWPKREPPPAPPEPGSDPRLSYAGPYLNVHPLLLEVFAERAHEAVHGLPHMNCELCKYRVQLPGFAEAVGQPQTGHHHHVRGIGQDKGHHHHDVGHSH